MTDKGTSLNDLGYNDFFEKSIIEEKMTDYLIGRVTAEFRERYIVKTVSGDYNAEITGNIRFTAKSREDYPAVGDWVVILTYDGEFALIHKILPRFSLIKRQAVDHFGESQVIAANIDYAFIVQAVDRDYNINRLERYLTICNSSSVSPVIVLSKTDLIDEHRLNEIISGITKRLPDITVVPISNINGVGHDRVKSLIQKGKTYCMLGSSGVGKSTLLNNLAGKSLMDTGNISEATQRGKHVTTHRELIILESGGILIDNPGMREVGMTESGSGLSLTFDKIASLGNQCRYKDCTHITEPGCRVLEAVESGEIDNEAYENYIRLKKEQSYFDSSIAERRKKDKMFGKIMKNYKKGLK